MAVTLAHELSFLMNQKELGTETMFDLFKTRAEAVSSEVHRFKTKAAALDFVVGFLQKEGVQDAAGRYAAWADSPFLQGVDKKALSKKLPGLRFDVSLETSAEAGIGISQADWGIADTGTLVQDSTAVEQRLVSTLPLVHVALLDSAKLQPDLTSLFSRIEPRKAAYLAFITGPSRTADIERVLTIGVHGPERLVIVCVDEQ